MNTSDKISLHEVAERLGVHYMTAYRYVRSGRIPGEQQNGQWSIRTADVDDFAARRSQDPPRPGRPPADSAARQRRSLAPQRAIALSDRLISGDLGGAWNIIDDALVAGVNIRQINAGLVTPALSRIGELWTSGAVTIGDEHCATVVAHRLIDRLGQHFNRPGRKRGTAVISAAPGDRHALPSAILTDLLQSEGLAVVDLGADTPAEDIVQTARTQDRLLGVGICLTSPLKRGAGAELAALADALRVASDRPVLLGGRSATPSLAKRVAPDYHSVDADDAIDWFVALT